MHPVDVHVGERVRRRRRAMGISQEKLGDLVGVTFQQVQKYEKGANRVSASKLFEISNVLQVPISFFFDGLASASPGPPISQAVHDPETSEIAEAVTRLPSRAKRAFRDLLLEVGDKNNEG